jgi:hypothetical protein
MPVLRKPHRPRRGRPVQPQPAPSQVRMRSVWLSDELIDALDHWRQQQEGECSRSDAIRRLIRRGIRADAMSCGPVSVTSFNEVTPHSLNGGPS